MWIRTISIGIIIGGVGSLILNGYMWWQERQIGTPISPKAAVPKVTVTETSKKSEERVLYPTRPKLNEQIGQLEIPRLGVQLPIIEGTDPEQLAKGVGHYRNSYLPGENNFCLLSGHRDTVFRRVGEIQKGDQIIVHTYAGTFVYRVESMKIVDADDTSVIHPTTKPILALSTCYPFNFIGPAPKRYVIFCSLETPIHP